MQAILLIEMGSRNLAKSYPNCFSSWRSMLSRHFQILLRILERFDISALGQILGNAVFLTPRQGGRLPHYSRHDSSCSILAASRSFRRFNRRACRASFIISFFFLYFQFDSNFSFDRSKIFVFRSISICLSSCLSCRDTKRFDF